jgi:WD40 repeat protein
VTQFYHGAVSPDGTQIIAGAQDNGTLMALIEEGTERWRTVVGGDGGYVAFDPTEPKLIYAESQNAGMRRSPNGGISFPSIRRGYDGEEFLFVTPFVIDPNFTRRLWLGGRHMIVTTNRGDQWARSSAPFPALVSAIAVQPGNSDRVLAGLANGQIARSDQATTSTPTTQWTLVQPREGFVSSLAFDPKNANLVYATYAGFGGAHVWKSADAGATWTSIDGNLPDMPVHSIATDPTRDGRLYLGTDLGVFVTLDGGQTWSVENTGFANAVTEAVVIAQGVNGPAIYAFTHGRGAWRAELVTFGPRRRSARR